MNKILEANLKGEVLVIKTEGYLNKDLGQDIQDVAQEHITNGINQVLIDLEKSNIVNSIGASIIIELIEQLQETDGTLAFCNLAPIIEKTFKIMGLTKYCSCYSNENDAIEAMS